MTATIVLNGITYTISDLENYGYAEEVTAGTGDVYPRIIAMMADAISDSSSNMVTTSTTSLTVGTGSQTFIIDTALPVRAGMFGFLYDNAAPTTNWMFYQVTNYTSATRTADVNVIVSAGSGTLSNWDVQMGTGPRGAAGATGSVDINGQSEESTLDKTDEHIFYDSSAAGNKKISHENLQKQNINELFFFI